MPFRVQHYAGRIITDTASVNVGKLSGAVKRLCDEMQHKPLYYPCQLHVIDRSLKIFLKNATAISRNPHRLKQTWISCTISHLIFGLWFTPMVCMFYLLLPFSKSILSTCVELITTSIYFGKPILHVSPIPKFALNFHQWMTQDRSRRHICFL